MRVFSKVLVLLVVLTPLAVVAGKQLTAQQPYLRSAAPASAAAPAPSAGLAKIRTEALIALNAQRKLKKLTAFKGNALLDAAAQAYAEEMAAGNFFSHQSPTGSTPETRLTAAGYLTPPCNCQYRMFFAENIAKGQRSAKAVVTAWMLSPGHKKNILTPEFRDVGTGFSNGVWVENYGVVQIIKK